MGGLAQNVQKPPPGKNVQKSQGQIFQEFVECVECQGQIFQECVECQECQGQMPRSNGKNPKVKWENKNVQKPPPGKNVQKSQGQIFQECVECQECQGQIFQECVECQECQGEMPRSNGKNPKVKWENKNVQKPPPGKNVQKSQGQIFQECVECQECQSQIFQECVECQECQGQMPRSRISGMPRSNVKVKFPKVKWETGKNRKNGKV